MMNDFDKAEVGSTIRLENKLAILSCIHSNLPALSAVLTDIESRGIKAMIHLGDSVGYGPEPEETVTFLAERNIRSVQGCWDKSIADQQEDCGCDFVTAEEAELGRQVFAWTSERVSDTTRRYLADLPETIRVKAPCGIVQFVHGSPRSPNEYLNKDMDALILLERVHASRCDFLVCGHTHIPYVHRVSGTVSIEKPHPYTTETPITQMVVKPKFVLNAGSVGEPLHGPEATYIVMDLNTGESEIIYIAYNIEETVRKMIEKEVPDFVIQRFKENVDITAKNRSCLC